MNPFSPFAITIWIILALSLIGLPIGLSMISASIVYLLIMKQDMGIAAEQLLQGLFNGYTLLAIPLFIFAADLMNVGSLSERLLKFCDAIVGRFRGGLGHVNVVANVILSGMSGSAVADAAGLGRIIINMMTRDGKYTPSYAAAITAVPAFVYRGEFHAANRAATGLVTGDLRVHRALIETQLACACGRGRWRGRRKHPQGEPGGSHSKHGG